MNQRTLFLRHLAQTSPEPLLLEIERAEGVYLYGSKGERWLDLISGIAVSSVGHRHPAVLKRIHEQTERYFHTMVYGELVLSPQVELASRLVQHLPASLDAVYLCNSGTEATEGAMKLAKRITGRPNFIAFENAYHGSSQGALSLMGSDYFKSGYGPLLPGIRTLRYNHTLDLQHINHQTAAVFVEPVQSEAGYRPPCHVWMQALAARCKEVGALLVMDEVQTGFGRTGRWFGFEHYGIIPDILTLAKGMGGGLPIGAFVSSRDNMMHFTHNPVLGHITTFGGNPLSAAAACGVLDVLETMNLDHLETLAAPFYQAQHPLLRSISGKGMMIAWTFDSFDIVKQIIQHCLTHGLLTDWFLFNANSLRICPPLTITPAEIQEALTLLTQAMDAVIQFNV